MLLEAIEIGALVVELFAVAVILAAVLHGTTRYFFHLRQGRLHAFEQYRIYIGKAMLLGLEFLVAADIVETVVLDKTLDSVMLLAMLVAVRTFLSWSLVVEIEGRWPWQARQPE